MFDASNIGYELCWPDHERRRLWCFIPKVGSSSQRFAVHPGKGVTFADAHKYNDYFTIAFVRQWQDRIVSAMFTVLRDLGPFTERMEKWITGTRGVEWIDMHVRPQAALLHGLRVDFLGCFETFDQDWRWLQRRFPDLDDLPHKAKGRFRPAHWRDVDYDWRQVEQLYLPDKKLCRGYL